ncbi:MAG: hypothetical protein KTR32_25250 [Granulosicoccus sp.]|nr:hypothetical protein [Granulosicoccus sp.]
MIKTTRLTHYLLVLILSLLAQTIAWQFFTHPVVGDEVRYLKQADRILAGENLYNRGRIVNPPLLPLILAGAQKIGISVEFLPLLSIAAVTIAALLLLGMLSLFLSPVWAVGTTLLVVYHPAVLMMGSQLLSEPWSILWAMISAVMLYLIQQSPSRPWLYLIIAALSFAALAMMKPLFGYTIVTALVFTLIALVVLHERHRAFLKNMTLVCVLALLCCVPFLSYTYSETGKLFKWSTGTGVHLWFMSIGGEDIWGSWVAEDEVNDHPFLVENGYADEINQIAHLNYQEKDRILQEIALQRIQENPQHFIMNVVANSARVLFNYPYSFRPQSFYTYGYILPHMLLYISLGLSAVFLWYTRRYMNAGIAWVTSFYLIYLGGNMLVGSDGKQGVLLVGPFLIWLAMHLRILLTIGFFNPDALRESESRFRRRRQ